MSIDKAIEIINHYLDYPKEKVKKALLLAIDTMRKYQKIEQIIKDDTYYEEYGNNAEKFIVSAISEVVENGNDD